MFRFRILNQIVVLSLIVVLAFTFNASAQQVVPLKGVLDPSEMVTLDTRPGVSVTFQVIKPAADPTAIVVLFAGGHGNL